MDRTPTPTPISRSQGAVITACVLALVTGLGLFGLRYEQERRTHEADARVSCMVGNLNAGRYDRRSMEAGC